MNFRAIEAVVSPPELIAPHGTASLLVEATQGQETETISSYERILNAGELCNCLC